MSSLQVVLLEPARAVLGQIGSFLIGIFGVLVILIAGWLISKLIKTAVTKGLRTIKLDVASDRIELDTILAKGGINYSLSELIGVICYWLSLLVTFMVAANAIGLTVAADLLNKIVFYIPNIIAAIFIMILGMFVATMLKNIVQTAANNAGLTQGNFLAKVVDMVVLVFAAVMALEQLGIGVKITEISVSILLGSVGLALALSFGLGCKDIAGKFVGEFIDKLKKK